MAVNTQPIDVYLGKQFLKLAKFHGWFYYSYEEKKDAVGGRHVFLMLAVRVHCD